MISAGSTGRSNTPRVRRRVLCLIVVAGCFAAGAFLGDDSAALVGDADVPQLLGSSLLKVRR